MLRSDARCGAAGGAAGVTAVIAAGLAAAPTGRLAWRHRARARQLEVGRRRLGFGPHSRRVGPCPDGRPGAGDPGVLRPSRVCARQSGAAREPRVAAYSAARRGQRQRRLVAGPRLRRHRPRRRLSLRSGPSGATDTGAHELAVRSEALAHAQPCDRPEHAGRRTLRTACALRVGDGAAGAAALQPTGPLPAGRVTVAGGAGPDRRCLAVPDGLRAGAMERGARAGLPQLRRVVGRGDGFLSCLFRLWPAAPVGRKRLDEPQCLGAERPDDDRCQRAVRARRARPGARRTAHGHGAACGGHRSRGGGGGHVRRAARFA